MASESTGGMKYGFNGLPYVALRGSSTSSDPQFNGLPIFVTSSSGDVSQHTLRHSTGLGL